MHVQGGESLTYISQTSADEGTSKMDRIGMSVLGMIPLSKQKWYMGDALQFSGLGCV